MDRSGENEIICARASPRIASPMHGTEVACASENWRKSETIEGIAWKFETPNDDFRLPRWVRPYNGAPRIYRVANQTISSRSLRYPAGRVSRHMRHFEFYLPENLPKTIVGGYCLQEQVNTRTSWPPKFVALAVRCSRGRQEWRLTYAAGLVRVCVRLVYLPTIDSAVGSNKRDDHTNSCTLCLWTHEPHVLSCSRRSIHSTRVIDHRRAQSPHEQKLATYKSRVAMYQVLGFPRNNTHNT